MSDMKQRVAKQAACFKAPVPLQKQPVVVSLQSGSSVAEQTQLRQADRTNK